MRKPRVRFHYMDGRYTDEPDLLGYWRFVSAQDWNEFERQHGIRHSMSCRALGYWAYV